MFLYLDSLKLALSLTVQIVFMSHVELLTFCSY